MAIRVQFFHRFTSDISVCRRSCKKKHITGNDAARMTLVGLPGSRLYCQENRENKKKTPAGNHLGHHGTLPLNNIQTKKTEQFARASLLLGHFT